MAHFGLEIISSRGAAESGFRLVGRHFDWLFIREKVLAEAGELFFQFCQEHALADRILHESLQFKANLLNLMIEVHARSRMTRCGSTTLRQEIIHENRRVFERRTPPEL